jgi:diacylglycerol kinase (ATP)
MWLVVLNRRSGKGKAAVYAEKLIALLKERDISVKVIDESSAEATKKVLANQLRSHDFGNLIAIGGDGLVHLCIQMLVGTKIRFGVIPAGTGNDFARMMGFHKRSVEQISEYILNNPHVTVDVGQITGGGKSEYFIQVLSTGFDSDVNKLANRIKWPKGKIKYTIAMLLILAKFKPLSFKIDLDGRQLHEKSMLFSVANGKNYGGGMLICPRASNCDGLFDLLAIEPVSRFTLLRIFPKVFSGSHIDHPKVKIYRAKQLSIMANTTAFADGEYVSTLPIEVCVVEQALNTWRIE